MSGADQKAAELKRACEASALLKIWRRHRSSDDDTLAAFAEWTLNNPDVVASEMPAELGRTTASLPAGSDQEKLNFIRAV